MACASNAFWVEIEYMSMVPSTLNGTDMIKKSKREFIEANEGFRVDLHL
jgi:hypothetical protein